MGAKREWIIEAEQGRQAVVEALIEMEAIGERCGGIFTVAPIRDWTDWGDGTRSFHTRCWRFRWESYMPTVQPPAEQKMPEEQFEPTDEDMEMHFPESAEVAAEVE